MNLIRAGTDKRVITLNSDDTKTFILYHIMDILHDNFASNKQVRREDVRLILSVYLIWVNEINNIQLNLCMLIEELIILFETNKRIRELVNSNSFSDSPELKKELIKPSKTINLPDEDLNKSSFIADNCEFCKKFYCELHFQVRTPSTMFDENGHTETCNNKRNKFRISCSSLFSKFDTPVPSNKLIYPKEQKLPELLKKIYTDLDNHNYASTYNCSKKCKESIIFTGDHCILGTFNDQRYPIVLAHRGTEFKTAQIGKNRLEYNLFYFQMFYRESYYCGWSNTAKESTSVYNALVSDYGKSNLIGLMKNSKLICRAYCEIASKWWGDFGMALDAFYLNSLNKEKTYMIVQDRLLIFWCQFIGIPYCTFENSNNNVYDLLPKQKMVLEYNSASKF